MERTDFEFFDVMEVNVRFPLASANWMDVDEE